MRSNQKAKRTGADFKKIKHKVGRRLPPPKNATKIEIKSKAIILPEQSLTVEKEGLAVNRKQQTLKELLMQTTHHNTSVRKDALSGIKDLFIRHPKEIKLHKLAIIEKLSPRISDADKGVRETLFLLFKSSIFPCLEEATMGPLISIIMAHIFNAMTQLAFDIRLMAFKFLDLVVQHYQSTVVLNYVHKVLRHFADLLGKTSGFTQDKGKLMDILTSLVRYLSCLQSSTQLTNLAPDQEKDKLGTLHGYKSSLPKKISAIGIENIAENGISVLVECLQVLVPVLLEGWAECAPSVCSVPSPDSACLECMVCILQGLNLVFKCMRRMEAYDSSELSTGTTSAIQIKVAMEKWLKAMLPFLIHRLLILFPLSPSLQCSHKVEERFSTLNTGICEISLEITNWVAINCLPTERILQFMENSLEGQMLPAYSKRFSEKHVVSLVPFIPNLILNVSVDWKERLLKAFTRAFAECNTNSTMKLSCLSSIENMLFHDVRDNLLLVFQREWVNFLPKLLWELRHDNPNTSKAVLKVLLHIGRSARVDSMLHAEYTELQPMFMPFFCMHLSTCQNKVKVVYGPFVKLPKDCQELAVDSIYYYSNFSLTFLESLARCCMYHQLDSSIMIRIIQVLQASFCKGHIKMAYQLNFLLTLIMSCKANHDNPLVSFENKESERALGLGIARYKAVTRIVCLCLSEMGDESLVLRLVQPTIFQGLVHNPPLDITCALLRVVVVLSTKMVQLPVQFIDVLPQYIYEYMINISRDHMMNEETQQLKVPYRYYILPCIFLFSRNEKLTSLVFELLESSVSEGSESQSEHLQHLCAVLWVVMQIYNNESLHYRLSVCELSTKTILKNINGFQVSQNMKISIEEEERLQKFYSQLKATASAVHNWKTFGEPN